MIMERQEYNASKIIAGLLKHSISYFLSIIFLMCVSPVGNEMNVLFEMNCIV